MYRGELMELLLSVAESARRLGIGKTRFFELLKAEELHAVRLGGRTLIPIAELERFVAQLPPRERTIRDPRRPGRQRNEEDRNSAQSPAAWSMSISTACPSPSLPSSCRRAGRGRPPKEKT